HIFTVAVFCISKVIFRVGLKIFSGKGLLYMMIKMVKEITAVHICFFTQLLVEVQSARIAGHQALISISQVERYTTGIVSIHLNSYASTPCHLLCSPAVIHIFFHAKALLVDVVCHTQERKLIAFAETVEIGFCLPAPRIAYSCHGIAKG